MLRRNTLKLMAFTLSAALMGVSLPASALTEGEDYVRLETPFPNSEGTLIKIFSYDCPFCYKYDDRVDPKLLPRVEKELGLKFKPVHLETRAKYGVVATEFFIICLLKDKAAGRDIESPDSLFSKATKTLYGDYHRMGERWDGGEAQFLETLTKATGVTLDEFNKERTSPEVQALRKEWSNSYAIAKIQGIPAYVVNGKYLIMIKSIRSLDAMFETIKELKALP